MCAAANVDPPVNANQGDDDDEDDDDNEEQDQPDSEAETGPNGGEGAGDQIPDAVVPPVAEPSELMQLEMSEDIRLGSPDDGSNNLDSDFHLLAVSQGVNQADDQRQPADPFRAESSRKWPMVVQDSVMISMQPPLSGSGKKTSGWIFLLHSLTRSLVQDHGRRLNIR